MIKSAAYAVNNEGGELVAFEYELEEPAEDEVVVEVLFCGICHTDYSMINNGFGITTYPFVPGHEYVGIVRKLGSGVTSLKIGDTVGCGYFCRCCKKCYHCKTNEPQFCPEHKPYTGNPPNGGFGRYAIVQDCLAIKIPNGMRLETCAPLMCGGITVYDPIVENNMGRGNLRIGVYGLGGLGHFAVLMAAKINKSNEVIVLSRSTAKRELALKLGAKDLVASADAFKPDSPYQKSFDYIIHTVPTQGDVVSLVGLLKPRGSVIIVAADTKEIELPFFSVIMGCKIIQTSCGGGITRQQDMLKFCSENKIEAMVEMINSNTELNAAMEKLHAGKVHFRYVVDIKKVAPSCPLLS